MKRFVNSQIRICLASILIISTLGFDVNASDVEAYADAQVDSLGTTRVNNTKFAQMDFQRVLLSAGCILGLKSEYDEGPFMEFHVRLLRCTPLYVGLSFLILPNITITLLRILTATN